MVTIGDKQFTLRRPVVGDLDVELVRGLFATALGQEAKIAEEEANAEPGCALRIHRHGKVIQDAYDEVVKRMGKALDACAFEGTPSEALAALPPLERWSTVGAAFIELLRGMGLGEGDLPS